MLRGLLTWGLLGFIAGAYYMAQADSRTQHMVRQRSEALGRRMTKVAARALRPKSVARQAVENTLQLLRVR